MIKIIKTILSLFAIVFISYFIIQFVNTPAKNLAEKARDFAITQKIKLEMLKDSARKNLDIEKLFEYFKETENLSNPQNKIVLKKQILEKTLGSKKSMQQKISNTNKINAQKDKKVLSRR